MTFISNYPRYQTQPSWSIEALDVGQGSAIIVHTQNANKINRYSLYDTGGAYSGGFSMASSVILPYLKAKGAKQLDYLFLSHLDNDHAGGLSQLTQEISIQTIVQSSTNCNRGQQWQWHQLTFSALWPLNFVTGEENNHSCVIRVSDGQYSVLFSGDIEKSAEDAILIEQSNDEKYLVRADVLVAPHHGSQTSSSSAFVKAVKPEFVIFTTGANNRWNFPHQAVTQRYRKIGATMLNTGEDGRVKIEFYGDQIKTSLFRKDEYPRWYYTIR